jgi:formylglycine-generating enzyme required for sulfatase activity
MMKARPSKHRRFLSILFWAVCAAGLRAPAQTPPTPDVPTRAGVSIQGPVGAFYSVEYVTDPAQTNANHWRCLAFLKLPATNYLWFDPTLPAAGRRFYRAVAFAAPTNMVLIPPGTFSMGSPTNETDRSASEGPRTAVTISRGFWMGKFLVTQKEYLAVMGANPSAFAGDLNRPVESVNWNDATTYCARVTHRERAGGRIAANSEYRLPTEAEREYACRAGTSTRFSYGDDPGYTNLTNYAWYRANSDGTTHPVGEKLPNPWGLYEMHGNVLEWCQDWSGAYPGRMVLDPQGPATGSSRVFRGGLWDGPASYCRSASRGHSNPGGRNPYIGFRVVLAPGQ